MPSEKTSHALPGAQSRAKSAVKRGASMMGGKRRGPAAPNMGGGKFAAKKGGR